MWIRLRSIALAAVLTVCSGPASAALPRVIDIQGAMATSGGSPASGTYSMTFKLFPAETGGTALYTQSAGSVVVAGGLFEAALGPFPAGIFETAASLWLETTVEGEALPRKPLRSVGWSLMAERANAAGSAEDVSCTGCVAAAEVAFNYAGASTKGGAALDLSCTGCVESAAIAGGAIATAHIQSGAVTSDKASFPYAGSASKGGAALDLACTSCVSSAELAAGLALSGDVSVTGHLSACTGNAAGCAVHVSESGLYDHSNGWLTIQSPNGVRTRNADNSAWRPIEHGGGSSFGHYAVTGNLTATGALGVGTTSPAGTVEVRTAGGDATLLVGNGSQQVRLDQTGLRAASSSTLALGTASDPTAVTIATSGDVGLGVSAPKSALHVDGAVQLGADTSTCTSAKAGAIRWSGSKFEGCTGTEWKEIGTGGGGTAAPIGPYVATAVVTSSQNPTVNMVTIPALAGKRISVQKIAICGDSDTGSGPNQFRVAGAGLDFTFAAGQSTYGSTYALAPTPAKSGSARGFSYQNVLHVGNENQPVTLSWTYHNDWDGRYCQDTDSEGNSYTDQASSVRGWVLYYYTEGTAPSGPTVFSAVVTSSQNPTTTMGTIPGANGKRIRITQIGICGDSDSGSGPNRFTVSGGGFDFSFAAGQSSVSTTYFLGVTPTASGSGRGFITKSVSLLGSLGQGATVQWDYHNDWDGRFCQATDPYGNAYNDGASSVRSWIAYTYE